MAGTLHDEAVAVLEQNHRDGYTVPAIGLYPYQWCWDSGPIALGWAAAGRWTEAWSELDRLLSAQWATGMVPHIVFWKPSPDYFPGPDVWATHADPPSTGITQPPLPISAAARLFTADPDRDRAAAELDGLWPRLVAWLEWIERARSGPHGACVVVHPWESGMDNSPRWDAPLEDVPEASHRHLERRDVATVAAAQRPTEAEYRRFLGIVERLRAAGWDTERQVADSPFAVEDVTFTAITARAAADLASAGDASGHDTSAVTRFAASTRAGIAALWDDDTGWFRSFDVKGSAPAQPLTAGGPLAWWARAATAEQTSRMLTRLDDWAGIVPFSVPSSDPTDPSFEPERYWRGPVWVLVNWMIADGLASCGHTDRAERLRTETRALVERSGFCEYFDPRTGDGIGGHGFSWTAALTLAWLIL
ncbi:MAG TPA: trehalase family glycosidase [Acidimicrobiia bacterium]